MHGNSSKRPSELNFAIGLASLGLLVTLSYMIAFRHYFGDAWILLFTVKGFVSILYVVLFILAYNGFGWVRYVYAALFLVGMARVAIQDLSILMNPWMAASTALSAAAIVLWFMPKTNRWYRHARSPAS